MKNTDGKSPQFTFKACTEAILKHVPACARPPIGFTARAALERSVLHMVQRNVINGKSFQDESEALREVHLKRLYEQMVAYYDYCKRRTENKDEKKKPKNVDPKQPGIAAFMSAAAPAAPEASTSTSKTPQAFPMPKTTEFRAGMGAGYLISVYLADFKRRQEHLACHLASIGGRALAGDHTFQTAKHVTEVNGSKSYEAVFDMNNEYGQIVALLFTATKSMDEIAPQLQQLNEAWEELKVKVSFSFRCV
jgi:flagellin-specific chaperone FliS